MAEVLQGFRADDDYKIAKSLLMELPIYELIGIERALKAAENSRYLRKRGITVRKTTDTLIASFCIEKNYPLLFRCARIS